jgi:four helix bundle protein
MSGSYRDLKVWQLSFEVVRKIYLLTDKLPKNEVYGLSSQMQRAAISIPSNIAEGQQRGGPKEFKQFLYIARGSAAELSTQLLLTQEIYKVDCRELVHEVEQTQKMLYALVQKL